MSWIFDLAAWALSVIKARWIMFLYAAFLLNAVAFAAAYLTSLYSHLFSLTYESAGGGGTLYYSIIGMFATMMPANAKAVFILVVSVKVTKLGLRIYLILQKYYFDVITAMNR